MTNKNPYEIRLEILKMAKEMVDRQYEEASNAYTVALYNFAEKWNKDIPELLQQTAEMRPQFYSPQEIMDKAQELYRFVYEKS